ncbi:MAG TPA: DUF1572 domain-containing protein [Cytophagales bacterium]|nr:DUF1572 domain-containing protein [Cytophagales bacterium]HAA21108.1 DUF1572 domain-containing protein [Cytophagales bacterium]HAP62553.1 DUF1572 domain-containing protein [Cytophagales bacterium]
MENTSSLARRFREVILDGKWIANTNFQEQLSKIGLAHATEEVGSLNSIAALTFHVNYYIAGVLNVFEGGELEIRDKYSFDLPEITSEEDWVNLVQELISNAGEFTRHVDAMTEEQLESPFVDEKYGSYRRNIEGMIEHCYYHLGQVSLIRKMLNER